MLRGRKWYISKYLVISVSDCATKVCVLKMFLISSANSVFFFDL